MDNPLKKQTTKLKRAAFLTQILTKYGFEDIRSKIAGSDKNEASNEPSFHKTTIYERIRQALEELGPTYVKFGQTLSTREDLFPSELIIELKKLQDNVPPAPLDIIQHLSETLQIDPQDYFKEIDTVPIASASIAQTYKAILQNGDHIIIKVKRPGIRKIVEGDLLLIKDIIDVLSDYYSIVREINLKHIFDAFASNLFEELSFVNELKNIQLFAQNFKGNDDIITIKAYSEISNDDILCISFIDGCKITDTNSLKTYQLDKELILDRTLNLFLTQILEHGFFHADPHPGNILVSPTGKIAFIDFGAMAKMLPKDKEQLEDFIVYFINKDATRLVATIKKMALHIDLKNEKSLERTFEELLHIIGSQSLEQIDVKGLFTKFSHILNENNIIMPEHIYLLVKGIVLIEGIGRELNPSLNIVDKVKPYISKISAQRLSPDKFFENNVGLIWELKRFLESAPKTLGNTMDKFNEGEFKVRVDNKEFNHYKSQQARNNSLNRILTVAAVTFIGACLLANVEQQRLWGIAIISWILIGISILTLIILFFKKNKLNN